MRVWLDTDIGSDVDDALAVAYALRHPDLEVVGISTVFGDLAIRNAIAEALLDVARQDRSLASRSIPVLPGLGVPLSERKRGIMFGHEGLGLLDEPDPTLRLSEEPGGEQRARNRVEVLAEAVDAAAPDAIVAIGPLTNLAALGDTGVALPRLVIMGGKLTDVILEGMVPEIPEWNWFCDPLAVAKVLDADHLEPPLIVPAEVTFKTRFVDGDIARLASGDGLAATLAILCDHWLALQRDSFGRTTPRVALHDPLTAAVLVEPSLCDYATRSIKVDDRGASRHDDDGTVVVAATSVDAGAVRAHVLDVILGRSGAGPG